MDSWVYETPVYLGSLLPAKSESAILLKSVVNKATDLIFFYLAHTGRFYGPDTDAATAVGAVFALINYQMTMIKQSCSRSCRN